ncbi:GNAT family N-acetyltransferase [Psychrobacillus sp. INOP01]|uniref:GNAT family N-acetyltransferase n=1 Tax=Psychrobacillus sp. INOP01 TaxID=2829187 RepID=UPI001BA8D05E|nr:GNAT family protein [Psychrobacillus sp. INOP01]QUG41913.1 GNAT family N-acetyltransferase [Psychrobacillus sp. INOP01]
MKLVGQQIYLRFYKTSDASELANLHTRNREFFQRVSPLLPEDFYTEERQKIRIEQSLKKTDEGHLYAFGIFLKATDILIGDISLTQIARGDLQSCYTGFTLDKEYNGKGYTTEALQLIVDFAFRELKLHRIEAGAMPDNIASIRVLEKAGFKKEGIAKENLKINGKWTDHQILGIINSLDV